MRRFSEQLVNTLVELSASLNFDEGRPARIVHLLNYADTTSMALEDTYSYSSCLESTVHRCRNESHTGFPVLVKHKVQNRT